MSVAGPVTAFLCVKDWQENCFRPYSWTGHWRRCQVPAPPQHLGTPQVDESSSIRFLTAIIYKMFLCHLEIINRRRGGKTLSGVCFKQPLDVSSSLTLSQVTSRKRGRTKVKWAKRQFPIIQVLFLLGGHVPFFSVQFFICQRTRQPGLLMTSAQIFNFLLHLTLQRRSPCCSWLSSHHWLRSKAVAYVFYYHRSSNVSQHSSQDWWQ